MPELLVKQKRKELESNYIKKFPWKIFYYIGSTRLQSCSLLETS